MNVPRFPPKTLIRCFQSIWSLNFIFSPVFLEFFLKFPIFYRNVWQADPLPHFNLNLNWKFGNLNTPWGTPSLIQHLRVNTLVNVYSSCHLKVWNVGLVRALHVHILICFHTYMFICFVSFVEMLSSFGCMIYAFSFWNGKEFV